MVKHFTPQEANRRLPYIRQIVQDILGKGQKLQALILLPHQTPEIQRQQHELQDKVEVLMLELESLGCYYKDWNFEIGLVDFPAVIHEQEVLLCWRSDEPAVRWYHGFEDGYRGRQLIPKDLL